MRQKTDAQFKQEVYDLVGDKYTFLEPYVNKRTKIKAKHNKCGHIYEVAPGSFLSGRRCSYCNGGIKKTDEQFKEEIFNLVGNEYNFLDNYINNHTKIRVKHNECGHIYKVEPNDFLQGSRCPYCNGGIKKSDKWFKQRVMSLVGNEYTFLDPYVNSATKLKAKHNKCGRVYRVAPNTFLSGHRCPYCKGTAKRSTAQFKLEVKNLVGDEYRVLGEYQGVNTKIKMRHNICGNVFFPTPKHFLKGSRCPYCSSSKGETIISKILDTLNINYEAQKKFDELRDIQLLSYDFFIPSQNILIEYQGKQHYEPINYFGGESQFKSQQKHDKMKLDYAKSHNYNLITVPYTEDTFSKIKKYLLQRGLSA